MNEQLIKKITKKRNELEEEKSNKSKIEGRLEQLYSNLKSIHQCNSLKEAEKKIKIFNNRINIKSNKKEEMVENWKEKYAE